MPNPLQPMKITFRKTLALAVLIAMAAHCGKKKGEEAAKAPAKVAYAVYQAGVFDTVDAKKASEWLNRAEMVTVLETVDVPDAKDKKKSKAWAKIERTTGKQGFVDPANLESKAFVVIRPIEIFNINQAAGKKLATVPAGKVGFVVEEKGDWVKVRFGYKVNENWSFADDATKWVDQRWAQLDGVSYDPAAIGHGVELEDAMKKFNDSDAAKKAAGKKDLETIVKDSKSQFIDVAQKALATADEAPKKEEPPAEVKPAEGAGGH